jgi:hypothetical protein
MNFYFGCANFVINCRGAIIVETGVNIMRRRITNTKLRHIVEELMIDLIREKPELFVTIFQEAFEDYALGKAIEEDARGDYVDEQVILDLLNEKM